MTPDQVNYREALLNEVLKRIKMDVESGDMTSIYEMLCELENSALRSYLPEITVELLKEHYHG